MAVKAKKRKLSTTARTDQEGRAPEATAEAELQRQEDEMLAMTRLLKQVDEKDVLVVAKHILNNTTIVASVEDTAHDSESDIDASSLSNDSSPTPPGVSDRSRQRQTWHTRSRQHHAQPREGIPGWKNSIGTDDAAEGQSELTNAWPDSEASASYNGTASTTPTYEPLVKREVASPSPYLSDATEHHDGYSHEGEDGNGRHGIMTNGSALNRLKPKRAFVSVLRSGRRRVVPLPETTTYVAVSERSDGMGTDSHSSSDGNDSSTSYVASISDSSKSCSQEGSSISVTFRAGSEKSSSPDIHGFDIPISALVTPRLTKSLIQQKARSTYAPMSLTHTDQPKRRPGRPPGYFLGPTSCAYCRTQHRRCDYNTVCMRCVKAKIPCDRSGTVERPSVIVREARQQAKAEAAAALAAAVAAGLAVPPEKPRPPQRHTQLHSLKLEAAVITSRMPTPVPSPSVAAVKRKRTPSPSDVTKGNIIDRRTKRLASLKPVEKYDPSIYLKPKRKPGATTQSMDEPHIMYVQDIGKASTSPSLSFSFSLSSSPSPPSSQPIILQRGRSRTRGESCATDSTKDTTSTHAGSPSRSKSKEERTPAIRGSKRLMSGKVVAQPSQQTTLVNGRGRKPGQELSKYATMPPELILTMKRGPGRPSNAMRLAMSQALLHQQQQQQQQQQPQQQLPIVEKVKRGPGRPRKDSYATTTATTTTTTSKAMVPLKRTRSTAAVKTSAVTKLSKGKQVASDIQEEDSKSTQEDKQTARLVKKSYLKSGLYSADLKVNPVSNSRLSATTGSGSKQGHHSRALAIQGKRGGRGAQSTPFFQLPINYGAVLMDKQKDFRLPFDIMQAWQTQERGFGIQTIKPIKKGSLVIEYRGEVISQSECHRRMETIYKNNKNFYFLEYEKGEVVDACQKGTNARFVNHSQIEKWYLNGEMMIGIFASQDIPAGAEISYDYNFSSFSGAQKQKCRCGAPNCRGYIGERISKNKEPVNVPSTQSSGRAAKKVDGRKRKAGRRKLNEQEASSVRLAQMPTLKQIRQRQADKHKGKMAAIRFTRLFLFRNIRLVESKYIKYAQTKSRSYHESASREWLIQARQGRKRSLEEVVNAFPASVERIEVEERRKRHEKGEEEGEEESSVDDDDGSDPSSLDTPEGSFAGLDEGDTDADEFDEDDSSDDDDEEDDEDDEDADNEGGDDDDDDDDDDESDYEY
ncbi:Histone-Lysine N-Methyltransferase ash1l [Mortierella sp. NVP85]|nr:Histone-Lysine N-Methyltransferase ash1l [Mortierella sp. NVP85]